MFVYTVRASFLKVMSLLLAVLVIVGFFALNGSPAISASAESISALRGIKTEEDRREFLSAFGIQVSEKIEEVSFVMPSDPDKILKDYNQVQIAQGLDILNYSGKKLTRYTYTVSNFDGYDGEVYANLFIYKSTIVGCDLSSSDPSGFIKPIMTKKA